jgi:hypothetical protein
MKGYRISLRHSGDHEGVTLEEIFPTFDEAWWHARRLVIEPVAAKAQVFELKFTWSET